MLNPLASPFVPRCPPPSPAAGPGTDQFRADFALAGALAILSRPPAPPTPESPPAPLPESPTPAALPESPTPPAAPPATPPATPPPAFPRESPHSVYARELKWAVRNAAAPAAVFARCLARVDAAAEAGWGIVPARLPDGAGAPRAVGLVARGAADPRLQAAVAKVQRAWRRRAAGEAGAGAALGGWGAAGMSAAEKARAAELAAARARRLAPLADIHRRWRPQV